MTTSKRKKDLPLVYSILDSPAFGGAEQYLLSNLRYLSQQGYPVCLATNNQKVREQFESTIKQYGLENFQIVRFPFVLDAIGNWKGLVKFFFWAPFALMWQIQLFLKLRKYHKRVVCYWAGFSDRLLLSVTTKLFDHMLIWVEIGPLEPTFKKTWGFPKWLYFLTQHFPDQLITTSLWTKQSIVKNTNILSENVTLIYPGVVAPTEKEISEHKKQGNEWRKEHGFQKKFIISFIGRMATENEVDVLLKALSYFHKNFHQTILTLIIGDGPEKSSFQNLAKSLDIERNVIFTGFVSQEEKLAMVATSDLFVFARAWDLDGFGMTPLEGMSVKVPVITTDFGPQKEIVIHKKNGLSFKPHNPEDLSKMIRLMYEDASLRKRLTKEGQLTLSPKFTEETMNQKTLRVISSLKLS